MILFSHTTMACAGHSSIEYALCALRMKHAERKATPADATALYEHADKQCKTTHDTYHELLVRYRVNMTLELRDQLESLYTENLAARTVIFKLHQLEQEIADPECLPGTCALFPSNNEIVPTHRNM